MNRERKPHARRYNARLTAQARERRKNDSRAERHAAETWPAIPRPSATAARCNYRANLAQAAAAALADIPEPKRTRTR